LTLSTTRHRQCTFWQVFSKACRSMRRRVSNSVHDASNQQDTDFGSKPACAVTAEEGLAGLRQRGDGHVQRTNLAREAMAVTWHTMSSPCSCPVARVGARRAPAAVTAFHSGAPRASACLRGCQTARRPSRRRCAAVVTAQQQPMLAPRCACAPEPAGSRPSLASVGCEQQAGTPAARAPEPQQHGLKASHTAQSVPGLPSRPRCRTADDFEECF